MRRRDFPSYVGTPTADGPGWRIRVEPARDFDAARARGVAFLWVGHGWNAGDLFEWLRDDGLVTGSDRALGFTGAGGWRITER